MTNVNFAMEVHAFGDGFLDGLRLVDNTAVRVRLDPLNTGSRDRRCNVSDLRNSMRVGGVVSVERWHLQGPEPGCYYAGFLHLLNSSRDNTEDRSLHSAMTKPGMPYVGAANLKPRAYVDILFNKHSCVVPMKTARGRILTSYMMNDFSLGNPFVLLRDAEAPKISFQLPVCYKIKGSDGRWVRPGETDLLKALNSDKYKRFPRLMERLANRTDLLEVVAGVRAQVSSALASDSRYLALLNQVYTVDAADGKTVPNYRDSMVSFKKHTSKDSEDYYLSYLAPTLADPRQPNLTGVGTTSSA